MITELARIIKEGESLRISLEATGGDHFAVTIIPVLRDVNEVLAGHEEDQDKKAAQIRAALTVPLRISGSAAWLDENLVPTLAMYAERRGALKQEIAALDALREATKEARAESLKSQDKSGEKDPVAHDRMADDAPMQSGTASPPPPPAPSDPSYNPDSLF